MDKYAHAPRTARFRLRFAVGLAGLLTAATTFAAPAAGASVGDAGTAGFCPDESDVTLILDATELAGDVDIACVAAGENTGNAFKDAGLTGLTGDPDVCGIDNVPGLLEPAADGVTAQGIEGDEACLPEFGSWQLFTGTRLTDLTAADTPIFEDRESFESGTAPDVAAAASGAVRALVFSEDTASAPDINVPLAAGSAWLVGQLTDGLYLEDWGAPAYGNTADVAFSLAWTGADPTALADIVAFVTTEASVDTYVAGSPHDTSDNPWAQADCATDDPAYVGATAKLGLLVAMTGGDPRNVGGRDLVATLRSLEQEDGSFDDRSNYCSYDNVLGHAFALLLLTAAADEPTAANIEILLDAQCDDGGFPVAFGDDCSSGPDATGLALQALAAASDLSAERAAARDAAAAWLRDAQLPSGAWSDASFGANANSTAYATMGLVAIEDAAADAGIAFLAGLQQIDGGFAYEPAAEDAGEPMTSDAFATSQALGAAARGHFLGGLTDLPRDPLNPADDTDEAGDTDDADGASGGTSGGSSGGSSSGGSSSGGSSGGGSSAGSTQGDTTSADDEPEVLSAIAATRTGGAHRYDTAIQLSREQFDAGQASAVVLARGDDPADALSGTPLAVYLNAPVLITESTQLRSDVLAEIERVLRPGGTVHILGGTAALTGDVENSLHAAGLAVERHAGTDRIDTSLKVAAAMGNPTQIVLADGFTHQAALAGGTAAASLNRAGTARAAVLLSNGSTGDARVDSYFADHNAVGWAVGSDAQAALPGLTEVGGSDPVEIGVAVATAFFPNATTARIVRVDDPADALGGAVIAARLGGPVLYTPRIALAPAARDWLCDGRSTMTDVALYGGTQALSELVATQVNHALGGIGC